MFKKINKKLEKGIMKRKTFDRIDRFIQLMLLLSSKIDDDVKDKL